MKSWFEPTFIGWLVAMLVMAIWLLMEGRPALLGLGLGLSAAAPLIFLLHHKMRPSEDRYHPVLVSVLSGFGCVMTMVGVHRFGDQHQWILALALVALAGWMVYQRWFWRRPETPPSP
ncbi:MAG: hypothetical protein ACNA7J_01325 [Wenzhouxiangella sp.]